MAQSPELIRSPARQQVDKKIHRRMRASRWAQRGLLALGISAGLVTGHHNEGDPEQAAAVVAGFAVAEVAAGAERLLSKRTGNKLVLSYATASREAEQQASWRPLSGQSRLHVIPEEQRLREEYRLDQRAIDDDSSLMAGVMTAMPSLGGWLGGAMYEFGKQRTTIESAWGDLQTTGLILVAAGVVFEAINESQTNKFEHALERQLDNIDSGLLMERPQP